MLNISPLLFLIPVGIYLVIHIVLGLINVLHIFKTGNASFVAFFITFIFLFYSLVVISITWGRVNGYAWQQPLSIESESINSVNPFYVGQ